MDKKTKGVELLFAVIVVILIGETFSATLSPGCGGFFSLNIGDTGTLKSNNYPSNYGNLDNCIWFLEAPTDYAIVLDIQVINGETGVNGTCNDYLEVRDGNKTAYQRFMSCSLASNTQVTSPSRWMWVRFSSNYDINSTGFTATFSTINLGYTNGSYPRLEFNCKSYTAACPNRECIPTSMRCDGYNDCGYIGVGSDEDYRCDIVKFTLEFKLAIGVGVGCGVFFLIYILAIILEGKCDCKKDKKGYVKKGACFLCCYRCSKRCHWSSGPAANNPIRRLMNKRNAASVDLTSRTPSKVSVIDVERGQKDSKDKKLTPGTVKC